MDRWQNADRWLTARTLRVAAIVTLTLLIGNFLSATAAAQLAPAPRMAQKVRAQIQIQGKVGAVQLADTAGNDDTDANFVQPGREQLLRLSRAEKLLTEERFTEGVRLIGEILNGEEDGALPRQGTERVRFLKAEALRLLSEMTPAGHAAYELQFGAHAQRLLDQSVQKSDVSGLEAVVRQFFHTKAGYEATHLLGIYQMEHGRPLAAALSFKRLADQAGAREAYDPELSVALAICWHRAGMTELGSQVLVDLRKRRPDAEPMIGGKPVRLFTADSEAAGWLIKNAGARPRARAADSEQWVMFRGGTGRNATSVGGRPLLNYRWRVPISDDPGMQDFVGQLREAHLDQNVAGVPALHPLAVRGTILMRTSQQLLAVDFATGKRIWEVRTDETGDRVAEARNRNNPQAVAALATSMEQRLWEDSTFGTLSSDGEYVYSIEDLGLNTAGQDPQQRMVVMFNGRRRPDATPKRYNRLAAHELATEGKLKWSLGGPKGDEEYPEAGSFFLGPPLPLGGRLYVMAEMVADGVHKGEIRLLAINPKRDDAHGEKLVEWSLPLAVVEQPVFESGDRRLAGVSPSYADGVLVCPTGAGVVVAVDLTTRSLLWGRSYAHAQQNRGARFNGGMMRMNVGNDGSQNGQDGWVDSSVTIAEGKVLLTPAESDRLLCLNLTDGELLWEKARDAHRDGLYLACVEEGKAVVVGRTSVRAFQLANGTQAWELPLASGGAPSGRGFFNGGRYYLPLSSAEVATIELSQGKELERARSRQGIVPGNLICYQGAVISQSVDSTDCFYQSAEVERQVAQTLKDKPDDPEALSLLGELLLDQGKAPEGADQLRRSLKLRDDPRARELLVDALLEGLRTDFARNRGTAAEIEPLLEQPAQSDAFLRVMAAGLHAAGEHLAAFDAYLKLAAIKLDGQTLARTEPGLMVRRDRWVQARIATLREAVSADDRAKMDSMVEERLQACLAAGPGPSVDALRQFLRFFGMHPAAQTARQELAGKLSERDSALEIELLLRRVAASGNAGHAAAATARLAEMMQNLERPEQAALLYAQLAERWADVEVRDGKTGRQLQAELPEDSPVRQSWTQKSPFPVGLVESNKQNQQGSPFRTFPMEISTMEGSLQTPVAVDLDIQRNLMLGRDSLGRALWQVPLAEIAQQNQFGFQNPGMNRARLNGHLLIASLGFQVVAVDTLGAAKGTARVVWKQDLNGPMLGGNPFQLGIQHMREMVPWGGQARMVTTDTSGRRLGMIGPCTNEYVCFMRGRNLVTLDPLTGETLWIRQGLAATSQLFGDDEMLFVADDTQNQALVLRASDGVELGRRPIPPANERMTTIGRKILTWSNLNGKVHMRLVDPWTQTDLWKSDEIKGGAKAWINGQESVGVLEPEGKFVVLNLSDGAVLLQDNVEAEATLSEIYVIPSRDQFVLIANTPQQQNQKVAGIQPVPGGFDNPVINGRVYGFDRETAKRTWTVKLEHQGLMLNQPVEMPVIVFAAHVYKRDGNNPNNITTQMSLLCIDKRNGRVAYQEESPNAISHYELVARPEAKAVDLKLPNQIVTLTFTDKPLPEPAKPAEEKKQGQLEKVEKVKQAKAGGSAPAQAAGAIIGGIRRFLARPVPAAPQADQPAIQAERARPQPAADDTEKAIADDEDAESDDEDADEQAAVPKAEALPVEIEVQAIQIQAIFPALPVQPAQPVPVPAPPRRK